MSDSRRALDAALARLDEVFIDPPPLSGPVRGCGYCWDAGELAALAGPPGKVPEPVVSMFVNEVVDHLDFGDQYTVLWRRLAPRALRRIAEGMHSLDRFYGLKLGDPGARLASWPEAERAAVTAVLGAILRGEVERYPRGGLVQVVEGLVATSGEVAMWLDRLGRGGAVEDGLRLFGLDVAEGVAAERGLSGAAGARWGA